MATPILIGTGIAATAIIGRAAYKAFQKSAAGSGSMLSSAPRVQIGSTPPNASKFLKGGFDSKMTRREAALVLGIREGANKDKLKEAHRRIMLLNHPDRGGSPFLASKINEAKDMLDKGR
ncbi:DnaJ of sub C member 19 [Blyttiomyces sp. JEL0837]|nr:DnaJ of sub C member 19 [Blyttiomyces sp. JEL0837]